jgi:peptidoglycan hydrolase-like protein with peptidoglycan-binding domain
MLLRLVSALVVATTLGSAAYAEGPRGRPDILSELPADAPPGECYARVRVPGGPVQGPPQLAGARWEMRPGPPGAPGPIWCLVPTGPAPVAFAPDRYGFVRVLCDDDLTGPRVTGIQRQLHRRGHYKGPLSGRYDQATASAVADFQRSAQISHGGYLSLDTIEALEVSGGYPPAPYPPGVAPQTPYPQPYAAPTYAQPTYPTAPYAYSGAYAYGGYPCLDHCAVPPPPCYCAPPPCCVYGGGYSYGYGAYLPPPAYVTGGYAYGSSYSRSGSVSSQTYTWGGRY